MPLTQQVQNRSLQLFFLYKMAKEHRGDDGATERPKKAKEEKRVDQVSSGLLVPCPSQRPVPVLTLAAGLPA